MVEKSRLIEILDKSKEKKIAVIGEMMLDEYIIGTVERISPEAPVPVVNVKSETFSLGGAANVINNLFHLNVNVLACGVIGEDDNGSRLKEELIKNNIDIRGIFVDEKRPTTIKRRVIAHNQQLLRLDWEMRHDIERYLENEIISCVESEIDELDAIILSDYDKGTLTSSLVKKLIKIARAKGIIITVDPKPENKENYIGATSMTPNTKEAMKCMGISKLSSEESFINGGKNLRQKLKLDNLLITRSEKGMSIFSDNSVKNIPTYAKEVYDVTGAGDTVIAVYTLALCGGASHIEAAKIANAAAGVVVARVGASTASAKEIIEFYEKIY